MGRKYGLRNRKKTSRRLFSVVALVLLGGIIVVVASIGVEPVVELAKKTYSSATKKQLEASGRGVIYDRNYTEIATSLERVSVYARTRELTSFEDTAKQLASVLDLNQQSLLATLRGDELRKWLVKGISQKQEDAVSSLNLPGIYLHREQIRHYPQKMSGAHLVGFVEDDIGLAGVEYFYDHLGRRIMAENLTRDFRPNAPHHLILSLDLKVQNLLESLVQEYAADRSELYIGGYIMDAGSGALLASVQYPSYDPNNHRKYHENDLESIFVKQMILPMKYRRILSSAIMLNDRYQKDDTEPMGQNVSQQVTGVKVEQFFNRIGTLIDSKQEFSTVSPLASGNGLSSNVMVHSGLDLGKTPTTLSPLQLLSTLTVLVNGGRAIKPHAVRGLVDAESSVVHYFHKETATDKHLQCIPETMSDTLSYLLALEGEADRLGGATLRDTAVIGVAGVDGPELMSNELYFSAIPTENAELTLLVTVQRKNQMVVASSDNSLMDFGQKLVELLPRIAVHQSMGETIADSGSFREQTSENLIEKQTVEQQSVTQQKSNGVQQVESKQMPALVGMSFRKGLRLLQNQNCQIRAYGTGRIVAQEPKAGVTLTDGTDCILRLQRQHEMTLESLEGKLAKHL